MSPLQERLRHVRPLEAIATVALVIAGAPSYHRAHIVETQWLPMLVAPLLFALGNNIAEAARSRNEHVVAGALCLAAFVAVVIREPHGALFVACITALSLVHGLYLKRVAVLGGAAGALIAGGMLEWTDLASGHDIHGVDSFMSALTFLFAFEMLKTSCDPNLTKMVSRDGCVAITTGFALVGGLLTVLFAFIGSWRLHLTATILACVVGAIFVYVGVQARRARSLTDLKLQIPIAKVALVLGIVAVFFK